MGPGEALRRVMECIASGILLPGQWSDLHSNLQVWTFPFSSKLQARTILWTLAVIANKNMWWIVKWDLEAGHAPAEFIEWGMNRGERVQKDKSPYRTYLLKLKCFHVNRKMSAIPSHRIFSVTDRLNHCDVENLFAVRFGNTLFMARRHHLENESDLCSWPQTGTGTFSGESWRGCSSGHFSKELNLIDF